MARYTEQVVGKEERILAHTYSKDPVSHQDLKQRAGDAPQELRRDLEADLELLGPQSKAGPFIW